MYDCMYVFLLVCVRVCSTVQCVQCQSVQASVSILYVAPQPSTLAVPVRASQPIVIGVRLW